MNTLISKFPSLTSDNEALVFSMIPVALSNIPFHKNTESITRYFAANFPLHLAIHEVSPVTTPPLEYTQPHLHDDYNEINIIISQEKLKYKIQLGTDEFIVKSNSSIWIPRGMMHSANVLEGSGYFLTMRIADAEI